MRQRGSRSGHAYGAAAVTSAIKGVDFPCSKDQLIQNYGNKEVEVKKGRPQKLKELLQDAPTDTFDSPIAVGKALSHNK